MHLRFAFVSLVVLAACGDQPNPGDDSTTGSMFTSGGETLGMGETSVSNSDPSAPTVPTTTEEATATSNVSITTLSTTDADPSFPTITASDTDVDPDTTNGDVTTDPVDCPDPLDQPNNSECTDASGCGCASGKCFLVPILGGWCGECLVDTDCGGGGCSVPNPIQGTGATCNTGEAGGGCMTDSVCADPDAATCATILEVPGIITVATCSECSANADCGPGAPNCTIAYDIDGFTGEAICVPDGAVPNDGGCNLQEPSGGEACQSGFCGEASVMGLLKLGICGECNADADCGPGETCTDPVVDLEQGALVGSVCQ